MNKNPNTSFFYLKIFLLVSIVLILGSLLFHFVSEIANSKFRNNAFSVLYVAPDSKLIYVDKNAREVLFVALGDMRKYTRGKNFLGVSFALGIPINAMIVDDKPPRNIAEFVTSKNEWKLLFDGNVSLKNMNRYDAFKLISAMKDSPKDNKTELRINIFNQEDLKKLEKHFIDSSVNNATYTIEIENGTSINGLGNELALILGRKGFNVIAVRTARPEMASFVAFPGVKNSYIDSLLELTGFDYKQEKVSQAADITIFLGDDLEAMLLP